jgi:hypothetical protein
MNRIAIVFSLSALLSLSLPLVAAEPSFLLPPGAPAGGLQEKPSFLPLDKPAWTPKSCSASFNCGDGNTIACTGNSICQVYSLVGSVVCDGHETACPNRCYAYIWCDCGVIQCYSTYGNCNQETPGCNGRTLNCNKCPEIQG